MIVDLMEDVRRTRSTVPASVGDWADMVVAKAERKYDRFAEANKRKAEKLLATARAHLVLMSVEEMQLVLKIEDFLTRHTYIGKPWMKVLRMLIVKYGRRV